MERSSFELRSILLKIEGHLTVDERQKLCFLISPEDVPRHCLDAISKNGFVSMIDIWGKLLDRRKITVDNVNYLIERLEQINRKDAADLLRNYCPISFSLSTVPLEEQ